MCTGGDPGGGSDSGVTKTPATVKPKAGTKPGEAGRYTLPATNKIKTTKADPDKLKAMRQERAASISERGGGLKAESDYERESSIAELEGRLDKQPPGTLGVIARLSLKNQIKSLKAGATPVKVERPDGSFLTVGTVTDKGVYSGRSEYGEAAKKSVRSGVRVPFVETSVDAAMDSQRGSEREAAEPKREPVVEEPVSMTPVGQDSRRTTKARRGVGRRTAFGTRQSLVNLRNV